MFLQDRGEPLDPARTNLSQAYLARDTSRIANAYVVEAAPTRFEASFILAPGFEPSPADASNGNSLWAFDRNHPAFASARDRYRLYVFDETGEGHWDSGSSSIVRIAPPLDALLGTGPDGSPSFVRRRRVPFPELFTLDANGKPLRAQLSISTDYAGPKPGLWNGTGTWQTIVGGFDLLRDRLGIWINVQNPNGWNIGASKASGAPYPSGIVRGVEDLVLAGRPRFTLRLTCVIEGDRAASALAGRRSSSPTGYTLLRRVDGRDRYATYIKAGRSEFNAGAQVVVRDDAGAAGAEADARRLASEAGEVVGRVVIPRITSAYRLGDRVRAIRGRGLSLRTNAGSPTLEGEVFPTVVGVTWDFDGQQRTVLDLSDQREPTP